MRENQITLQFKNSKFPQKPCKQSLKFQLKSLSNQNRQQ
ncbi:unnamed protein product [Paramecium sonneborni]|uniref:Uncharacterized protein n=1 Tax=Paramecium sonneborni TaxID=65129 RepID=A0A8S1MYV2_9CILI|nr:unnamed protein product [Paramecium sonneborni]